jgi:hypothetical protein
LVRSSWLWQIATGQARENDFTESDKQATGFGRPPGHSLPEREKVDDTADHSEETEDCQQQVGQAAEGTVRQYA